MNIYRSSGVTMIEAMLVLVIGSMLLVLSITQYQTYKKDSDLRMVLYNIDALALAAASYYHANCGNQSSGGGIMIPGTLSPKHSPPPTPNSGFPLDINNDLVVNGYLKNPLAFTPIVNSASPDKGYSVQLNNISTPRTIMTCTGTGCTPQPVQIGTTFDWRIQIGVNFLDPKLASAAQSYLQAACLSTANINTNSVVSCADIGGFMDNCITLRFDGGGAATTAADAAGCPHSTSTSSYQTYLVFERFPLTPVNRPQEGLWAARPPALQNYQQQTTYPLTYLLTNSHNPEYQYFLCGS